jgi:hypothetical protein
MESCADCPFKGSGVHKDSCLKLMFSSSHPSSCSPGIISHHFYAVGRVVWGVVVRSL